MTPQLSSPKIRQARRASSIARRAAAILAAMAAALLACSPSPTSEPDEETTVGPPNLVLVTLCSFRFQRLGAAERYFRPLTPFLDSLAERGVFFESARSAASWTKPSTASLLTGVTPTVHQLDDYYKIADILGGEVGPKRVMPEKLVTLAELLGDAGYRTASRVNNLHAGSFFRVTAGFDNELTDNQIGTPRMLRDFEEWLAETAAGDPFFFFLFTLDAHTPYNPDYEFYLRTARDPQPVSRGEYRAFRQGVYRRVMDILDGDQEWPEDLQRDWIDLYDAEILQLDHALSRLPAILEHAGVAEETVIVVTADHGERFFEHGRVDHGWWPDEPVIEIPLIFAGPSIPRGVRVEPVVRSIDVYPTLASLAGVEPPDYVQGVSLEPFFRRPDATPRLSAYSQGRGGTEYALRRGPYKLRSTTRSAEPPRLYDVVADPMETHDLSEELPRIHRELREELSRWLRSSRALRREIGQARSRELTPEAVEELKSLGYLDG